MANVKSLGLKIDKLYAMKLDIDKEEQALRNKKAKFDEAKLKLMGELNKEKLKQVKGGVGMMSVANKSRVAVDDFDKAHQFIKKHNAWDLLPRNLKAAAVKERLENKEKLPFLHIETYQVPVLNKVK